MENTKTSDQSSQQNKDQSTQSTTTASKSQSQQTDNPQKGREQDIVNEQDQTNPVNPQEKMSGQG
jgi:hypothetical protein